MISNIPLIVAFRNFKRNKMVNLTATSVKHFLPNARIYCFTFYKDSTEGQPPLHDYITEYTFKTKYISNKDVHDDKDPSKTSGYGHPDNAKFFTEGYNAIFEKFKHRDEPVIMLAEDHFFTTGAVLKELIENKWHIAYASGYSPKANVNGSILGIVPDKVKQYFPIPEEASGTVEHVLQKYLLDKVKSKHAYSIKHRKWIDYCGDGKYTNSSEEIEEELKKANII